MGGSWTDSQSFSRWVEEHHCFNDAMARVIVPAPRDAGAEPPSVVTLELVYQVGGGLRAGDTRRLRRVRLRCGGVARFGFEGPGEHSTGHWSEGLEVLDSRSPIAFTIDVPGRLVIECDQADAEDLPDIEEVVQPWESDREVFLILVDGLPTPEQVIRRCAEQTGIEVTWRLYGGEARPAADVPAAGYDGWFLQRLDRIPDVQGGVMMRIGTRPNGVTTLNMTSMESGSDVVLWAAILAAFATLRVEQASCGNRELDADGFRDLARRKLIESGLSGGPRDCASSSSTGTRP